MPASLITISGIELTVEVLTAGDDVTSSRVNTKEKVLFRTCAHSSSGIASPAALERVMSGWLEGFIVRQNFFGLLVNIEGRSRAKKLRRVDFSRDWY